jgi:YVTN family beta-propeller protein
MSRAQQTSRVRAVSRVAVLAMAAAAAAVLGFRCQLDPLAVGAQNFASPQANPIAISADGLLVYVANTTSNSVSVIHTPSGNIAAEIPVGLEPVSLAVSPDGKEVWVSNHVSDSVSVIDTDIASRTRHSVIRTIQDLDANGVSQFDEPVGIAFASGKAYVALSSRNDVAVIDPDTYQVIRRIHIDAQEPRAITARDGYLYVVAFESTNQSQISGCAEYDPPQCTLGNQEIGDFVTMPNLPGVEKNIVIDENIPDRDLFVIDTSTDTVVDVVEAIGTLLYGVAVSSAHDVYITQTDARNAVNGLDGDNLVVLENRMFDNEIGVVSCGGASCGAPRIIALDPPLPAQPPPSEVLATPYGIQISEDDATLFVTAMGTSRLFTVDTTSGAVLGRLDLGPNGQEIPKGVVIESKPSGQPQKAYVLNTLDNSVSVVDVSDPGNLVEVDKIPVGDDPTPENVRKGRIAFMNAFASDHGNFSCESCHPDGNTDQLLWSIGGACFFGACSGDDEARTTMPVRGLRATIPLHWDGSLGDPIGGVNGAVGPGGNEPPQCNDEHSCMRHLVDASLSGVMCDQDPACVDGPSGLPGRLSETERENMAFFLASVPYPPARERSMDDVLSDTAIDGFEDFFVDQGGIGSLGGVTTCGDMDNGCHELPLLVSTNTNTLQGFDAPTMRGLNDRFVQFSMALSSNLSALEGAAIGGGPAHPENNIPLGPILLRPAPSPLPWDPAEGFEEDVVFAASFAAFGPIYNVTDGGHGIFQMIDEMSTGFSGAIGRQVTLSADTTSASELAETEALMDRLEAADEKGVVNLQAHGRRPPLPFALAYSYEAQAAGGYAYVEIEGDVLSHAEMLSMARSGDLVVTLTAQLPAMYGEAGDPQPLLRPRFNNRNAIGSPALPRVPQENPFSLGSKFVRADAQLLLNGQPTGGSITCLNGLFTPYCNSDVISVTLDDPPTAPNGIHTLQVQNPGGPLSNEMPLCRGTVRADCQ